jgi:branched-subunit amino acid ABC-type transport system permease component
MPSLTLLGQALVSGVLAGGIYGLLALGLSLSWGLLRLVNLAHFALALLGAYLTYQLGTALHLSPWLASLYVLPNARRAGIGTALVQHSQQFALARAISSLYLWTPGSTRVYENYGWTVLQHTTYNSHPITLMHLPSGVS